MFILFIYTALIFSSSICFGNASVLDGTELVMSFMVFRHGDRAPVTSTISFVTDVEAVTALTEEIGYGQLTDKGRQRGFEVGTFIRERYNELLSSHYNLSEVYIRSTDMTRTKMTVLAAMAAVYPAEKNWCEGAEWCVGNKWTPVPYSTIAPEDDFNLPFFNCPKFITAYSGALRSSAPEMAEYYDFLEEWSSLINFNVTNYPVLSLMIYDAYASQVSLGVPLGDKLEEILPQIQKVAAVAYDITFGNNDYVPLQAGVLLNEFFKKAALVTSGEDVQRVYIYSAHDVNVYSFMAASKIYPRQGVPPYGSLFSLELRKVKETGQYVVVPVYLKTPATKEVIYLQVEGCEGFCDIDTYQQIVSDNVRDVPTWREQCEWTEDYDYDYSVVV